MPCSANYAHACRQQKARFDYEILDKLEGGLKLTGAEVKSVKEGHVQLKGAFLHIIGGELWLKGRLLPRTSQRGIKKSTKPTVIGKCWCIGGS